MSHTVDFSQLRHTFEFVSADMPLAHNAWLNLETGEFVWHSDHGDFDDELPDDLDEPGKYLAVPHKNDLDLGKRLVMRFAADELPESYDKVREIFSRRGAYARFRDLLEYQNALQQWYDFEERETVVALRQWCEENELELKE